jgi:hypothetical protein
MSNFEKQQLLNYRLNQLFSVFGAFHNAWNTRDQRRTQIPQGTRVTEANIGGLLGHHLDKDKFGIQ